MAGFANTDQVQKGYKGGGGWMGGRSFLWWPTNRRPRRCARQGCGWWMASSARNAITSGPLDWRRRKLFAFRTHLNRQCDTQAVVHTLAPVPPTMKLLQASSGPPSLHIIGVTGLCAK